MNSSAEFQSCSSPRPEIIVPRSGPRPGALRIVRIEPPVLPPRGRGEERAIAVQGLLPLEGLAHQPPPPPEFKTARRHRPATEFSDSELRRLAQQFCVGVAEVIFGDRPVSQLVRCTSERVYTDLAQRSAMARSRRRMTQERVAHARLERVRLQRPNAKAAEICARLRQGERNHALAARLELVNGRWICVALEARTP